MAMRRYLEASIREDREGVAADLHYLRDRTGRETDFLVTVGKKPWFLVEAKLRETDVDPSLAYFRDKLKVRLAYQVVLETDRDFVQDGVRRLAAAKFLSVMI
jgi:hypothetical protein